jgi:hypothetical protein
MTWRCRGRCPASTARSAVHKVTRIRHFRALGPVLCQRHGGAKQQASWCAIAVIAARDGAGLQAEKPLTKSRCSAARYSADRLATVSRASSNSSRFCCTWRPSPVWNSGHFS